MLIAGQIFRNYKSFGVNNNTTNNGGIGKPILIVVSFVRHIGIFVWVIQTFCKTIFHEP